MSEEDNPVKILKLVRLKTKVERYGFSIGMHGWFINGVTYNRERGAVILPSGWIKNQKTKQLDRVTMVKVGGKQIQYLKDRLERMITDAE